MNWLSAPDFEPGSISLPADSLSALPTPADETSVRTMQVVESGSGLIAANDLFTVFRPYLTLSFKHCPTLLYLREELIERLLRVKSLLPAEFDLVLLDGWRSRAFQAELYEYYVSLGLGSIAGYVADPYSETLIPGHVTGGAVDLTLSYRGRPLALGSDYDEFSSRAHLDWLECEAPHSVAADLLRFLGGLLHSAGLAPYPLEWWHWSYGDQRWAAQFNENRAIYGEISSI